jgi:hypothetical protein
MFHTLFILRTIFLSNSFSNSCRYLSTSLQALFPRNIRNVRVTVRLWRKWISIKFLMRHLFKTLSSEFNFCPQRCITSLVLREAQIELLYSSPTLLITKNGYFICVIFIHFSWSTREYFFTLRTVHMSCNYLLNRAHEYQGHWGMKQHKEYQTEDITHFII